jgi:anti-anti-sigma regulatory factor
VSATSPAQPLIKLLNPQPRVMRTLEMSGMNVYFEVYTDETAALASF